MSTFAPVAPGEHEALAGARLPIWGWGLFVVVAVGARVYQRSRDKDR